MSKARDIADSAATINALDGVTATGTELNILDGVTATTAELNILDGVTATTAELNYVDGVTSNIQTQFNNLSGGGEQTFTATGAITAGDLVAIRSDGTVESVAETAGPGEAGEPTQVTGAGAINGECAMCFDPNQGAYIFMYRSQDNSGYLYGVVGVSTGSSISWGTPAAIASTSVNYVDAVYNSNTQNVCIHLNNSTSYSAVVAVTLNASTKSFTAGSLYNVVGASSSWNRITYDPDTQKTIQVWNKNDGSGIYYAFGSWSGTGYSNSGDGTAFSSTAFCREIDIEYDQSQDKVLIVWGDQAASSAGKALVGTVGASSISWGTAATFDSSNVTDGGLYLAYYPEASKTIVSYRLSTAGYANTITISGTTPSFGTKTNTGNRTGQTNAYDSGLGKIVEAYKKSGSPDNDFMKIDVYSVSGTTVVVDETISLTDEAYVGSASPNHQEIIYDTDGIYVFGYDDDTNSTVAGIGYDVSVTTTNAADWIGIAKEDIAGAASGKIYVTSGISEDQTGLTQGTGYYVTSTGGLSSTATGYPFVGYATDTTDILIGGKNLPSETGQSGKFLTTNGTNLSWGTPDGGAWTLITTLNPSAASTVDFEDFTSDYDRYKLIFTLVNASYAQLVCRMKVNGSYQTASYGYVVGKLNTNSGTYNINNSNNTSRIVLTDETTNNTMPIRGEIDLLSVNDSEYQMLKGITTSDKGTEWHHMTNIGVYKGQRNTLQGFRLYTESATTFTGTVQVYGLNK